MTAHMTAKFIQGAIREIDWLIDKQLSPLDLEGRRELLCTIHENIGARICRQFAQERSEREHQLRHFGSFSSAGTSFRPGQNKEG